MGIQQLRRAGRRAFAAWVVTASAAVPCVQAADELITSPLQLDKEPQLSHGWLAWTLDESVNDSRGTIAVRNLASGQTWSLGAGCLPDIEASAEGGSVRVAWLRWNPDDTWDVVTASLDGEAFVESVLAADVGFADGVCVAGPLTVWTQPGVDGRLAVTLHDGTTVMRLAGDNHCFWPAACLDADGGVTLVWDEYVRGSAALDYEVWLVHWNGLELGVPENLSQAPLSQDLSADIVVAPDGGHWIVWQSSRGGTATRAFVLRRLEDGTQLLPEPYPASVDPSLRGLVDLSPAKRSTQRPKLCLDEFGRPWLFVADHPGKAFGVMAYDRQLPYTHYDGSAWAAPTLLSSNPWEERGPVLEALPGAVRVVYQIHSVLTRNSELALKELPVTGPGEPLLLQPSAGPPPPSGPLGAPLLPQERQLVVGGQALRLVFADLHLHTFQSPDGMGERDVAVHYARDVAGLDALAVTDHDDRGSAPFLDWEYEHARGLLARLQSPELAVFTGFEWTNDSELYEGEIIGHRAVFDSAHIYRYTSPSCDELPEFYAAMLLEDAIGTPHHLGKFGGTTFKMLEHQAQPVTEVCSVHGTFEAELVQKLKDGARFGVTCAGDIHTGAPGTGGLAGIWVPDDGAPLGLALKDALRHRHCFGVRKDGMLLHSRVNGQPTGSELVHSGDLLLQYTLREAPGTEPLTLNVTRNGDWAAPVYQRSFAPGQAVTGLAVLPGSPEDAFYMLRLSGGTLLPQHTDLWSTPVWIDADEEGGYALASIEPPAAALPAGQLLDVVLTATDPDGRTNLADIQLHVALNGDVLGTAPLVLLLDVGQLAPIPDGWAITLAPLALPPGSWSFVLEVRDKQLHFSVAEGEFQIAP
jgi:hypothetical protein